VFGLVESHYRNERLNHMKKVLIGMAVAAMAVAGLGGSASAAPGEDTLYDQIVDYGGFNDGGGPLLNDGSYNPLILLAAGLNTGSLNLDTCDAGKMYTVFFPADNFIFDAVLAELDLELDDLLADKSTLLGLLSLHVVNGQFTYEQLESGSYTNLPSLGGVNITIDPDGVSANDNLILESPELACNGALHFIAGVIAPPDAPATPSCGANYAGQCPAGTSGSGSGSGLPKTGSESMALTYAALASLIAGAGVLVIRRRSIA